jgi:hypothetical protein
MPFAPRALALVIALALAGAAQAEPVLLPAANLPPQAPAASQMEAGVPTTSSFSESNEASSRRQAVFNQRIARRGERAIASLCTGCRTDGVRQRQRATGRVTPVAGAVMPDAESIYSRKHGFDPERAETH